MLKDNIKAVRQSKGLSQEELAIKLHAVRQTVSKWERGLSVPDADMLVAMSEIFEIPVSTLLGENVPEAKVDDLKTIAEKLEVINLQLAGRRNMQRKICRGVLIALCIVILLVAATLIVSGSPYESWDYNDPETAVLGTIIHSFEWIFVRVAPIVLAMSVVGIILMRKKS